MQKSKILFLTFLLIFFKLNSFAQQGKGYMMVAIKPSDAIIRLDTMRIYQKQSHLPVDVGTYVIKAWAPRMKMITDTIHIVENKAVLFRRKLEYTDEYKNYKKELRIYNRKRYLPGALTLVASLTYLGFYLKYDSDADKYLEKANASKEEYESLTDLVDIQLAKSDYENYKDLYDEALDRTVNVATQAMIVIPVAVVTTGVLHYYSSKLVKPVFNEVPLLSDISFDYKFTGQAQGPRLNFSFKF